MPRWSKRSMQYRHSRRVRNDNNWFSSVACYSYSYTADRHPHSDGERLGPREITPLNLTSLVRLMSGCASLLSGITCCLLTPSAFLFQQSSHRTPLFTGIWEISAGWEPSQLPASVQPGPNARTNVYGYLLPRAHQGGTQDGRIEFKFVELRPEQVADPVQKKFDSGFVAWCFANNRDPDYKPPTCRK
jgi:hypothetical protein